MQREKKERLIKMTYQEKIQALAEILQEDASTLTEDISLDTLMWDSVAMLALIAFINERLERHVVVSQLRSFKTIKDILSIME